LKYRAIGRPIDSQAVPIHSSSSGRVLVFPPASIDLAFDDSILDNVREMWTRVLADGDDAFDARDFCRFDAGAAAGEGDGAM
jgi:Rab proteins geranylgeranyltransferase component A